MLSLDLEDVVLVLLIRDMSEPGRLMNRLDFFGELASRGA